MEPDQAPVEADASTRDSFAWDTIRVILEGTSPLELPAMAVADRDEAQQFLRHYGFDLDDANDRRAALQIHEEAVAFIRNFLLSAHASTVSLEIPREIAEPADLTDLLVLASSAPPGPLGRWACAVLRVMHTIHHANRAFHNENLGEIRKQVLDPFRHCLQLDELGFPVLQKGDVRVPLEGVFFKEDKSRDSIILKLLHKPSNVAQDIYDWIGIQFVTRTHIDALLVVCFLRLHNLVTFANIVPGRSINNLVDVSQLRAACEAMRTDGHTPLGVEELFGIENLLTDSREFSKTPSSVRMNPFSGDEYRSIQFTCRQLIKLPHPARRPLERVIETVRAHADPDVASALVSRIEAIPIQNEMAFFFPYEIQILDYENYLKTRMGESSHAAYKKRQLQAARRRVLQGLV